MRDLTEKELALAPDWAEKYTVFESDTVPSCITFYCNGWQQWVYHKHEDNGFSPKLTNKSIPANARPIPRKTFDISEHEFSDNEYGSTHASFIPCGDIIISDGVDNSIILNKQDTIAIAKALGVTGDDL